MNLPTLKKLTNQTFEYKFSISLPCETCTIPILKINKNCLRCKLYNFFNTEKWLLEGKIYTNAILYYILIFISCSARKTSSWLKALNFQILAASSNMVRFSQISFKHGSAQAELTLIRGSAPGCLIWSLPEHHLLCTSTRYDIAASCHQMDPQRIEPGYSGPIKFNMH